MQTFTSAKSICSVFKLTEYIGFELIHYPDLVLCRYVWLEMNKTDKGEHVHAVGQLHHSIIYY